MIGPVKSTCCAIREGAVLPIKSPAKRCQKREIFESSTAFFASFLMIGQQSQSLKNTSSCFQMPYCLLLQWHLCGSFLTPCTVRSPLLLQRPNLLQLVKHTLKPAWFVQQQLCQQSSESLLTDAQIVFEHTSLITFDIDI